MSSIASQLERDRLRHRAVRLQAVVAALRHLADGPRPSRGLKLSLDHYERELTAVRRRMAT